MNSNQDNDLFSQHKVTPNISSVLHLYIIHHTYILSAQRL